MPSSLTPYKISFTYGVLFSIIHNKRFSATSVPGIFDIAFDGIEKQILYCIALSRITPFYIVLVLHSLKLLAFMLHDKKLFLT